MIQIMAKSAEEATSEDGADEQNAIEPPKQTNKLKLLKEIESAFMVLMDLELMVQVNFIRANKKLRNYFKSIDFG